MNQEPLDRILQKTLDDFKVSRSENRVLHRILDELDASEQQRDVLRHRAFELARSSVLGPEANGVLDWLEGIVKVLDANEATGASTHNAEAYFSPGDDCLNAINGQLRRATKSIDICVFTITDNRISDTIIEASRRVDIRIISDNDKSQDRGSDVDRLREAGIQVAIDNSSSHMHHKYAIVDGDWLINGSYNWTVSAWRENEENIVVSNSRSLVRQFQAEFDQLWKRLG